MSQDVSITIDAAAFKRAYKAATRVVRDFERKQMAELTRAELKRLPRRKWRR